MAEKKSEPVAEPAVSPKAFKCLAPGSVVLWGDVVCRVIAVTLREGVFVYQLGWCVEKERRTDSFSACELTPTPESKFLSIQPV